MNSTSKGWKIAFSKERSKRIFRFRGDKLMENLSANQTPSEKVINEIKYFAAFSVLKQLLKQEKVTLEYCQQANVAIAEKYGVSQLYI